MNRLVYVRQFKRLALGIATAAVALPSFNVFGQVPPAAYGKVPNSRQTEWYHRELQMFVHFNMNTFTNAERGTGNESPNTFAPTALDCGQWCRTAKNAGFKSMILVAKHHDGFCTWQSAQTTHDVGSSSWRGGTGDVVREFTDSCAKYGLKAGIYLSCGDFHHDELYPVPNYEEFYLNQTKELLRNYGTIWEMWWDGATNRMTASSFYRITDSIHKIQPLCAIWSDAAGKNRTAEMRWNTSEIGEGWDPCWATMDSAWSNAANGILNGPCYAPAEVDVSVRAGWFWHASGAYATARTLTQFIDFYCNSVGRNGGLLLNVPPDTRGRMVSSDSTRVDSLGMWVYGTFDTNLAVGATITTLHPRGVGFEPANILDTSESTYYSTPDANRTDTITLTLGSSKIFNAVMVREVISLGHRTTGWSVDYSTNGTTWTAFPNASNRQSIGYKWIARTATMATTVTASYVRLRITAGNACPAINTFGIYRQTYLHQPTTAVEPSVRTPEIQRFSVNIFGNIVALPLSFSGRQVTVDVLDLSGRQVARTVINADGSAAGRERTALPRGIYLARCSAGSVVAVQKYCNLR